MANPKPLMAKTSGTDPATAAVQSALRTIDAEGSGIAAITAALEDAHPGIRENAVRLSETLLASNPEIIFSSVDLPQPDGPTTTKNSPSLM